MYIYEYSARAKQPHIHRARLYTRNPRVAAIEIELAGSCILHSPTDLIFFSSFTYNYYTAATTGFFTSAAHHGAIVGSLTILTPSLHSHRKLLPVYVSVCVRAAFYHINAFYPWQLPSTTIGTLLSPWNLLALFIFLSLSFSLFFSPRARAHQRVYTLCPLRNLILSGKRNLHLPLFFLWRVIIYRNVNSVVLFFLSPFSFYIV